MPLFLLTCLRRNMGHLVWWPKKLPGLQSVAKIQLATTTISKKKKKGSKLPNFKPFSLLSPLSFPPATFLLHLIYLLLRQKRKKMTDYEENDRVDEYREGQ